MTEGDAPDPAACSPLGECLISNLPKNLPKKSPIEVTYAFAPSGRGHAPDDVTGGQAASIEIGARQPRPGQLNAFTKLAEQYTVE